MQLTTATIGVIFLSASVLAAEQSPLTKLRAGPFSIAVSEHGRPGELEGPNGKVLPVTAGTGEVRYGGLRRLLAQPAGVNRAADCVTVKYRLPGEPEIRVNVTYRLQAERDEAVLVREVEVRASGRLMEDLTVALPNWPGSLPANTWLPLINGTPGKLGTAVAGFSAGVRDCAAMKYPALGSNVLARAGHRMSCIWGPGGADCGSLEPPH